MSLRGYILCKYPQVSSICVSSFLVAVLFKCCFNLLIDFHIWFQFVVAEFS